MTSPDELLDTYREVRIQLAQSGLIPGFAKLYSQHTLISNGRPGLEAWRSNESEMRLHDAMRLLSVALAEREHGVSNWQNGARRAGELLEWLAHDELNPRNLPLLLLSAAAYQLAGYPARSFGLLNRARDDDQTSQILKSFLMSDFRNLLQNLAQHWREYPASVLREPLPWSDEDDFPGTFRGWVVSETLSALGVLCGYMRWGDESRLDAAVRKLSAVADLLLHDRDPYSWLVAKLSAEVATEYRRTSLRNALAEIMASLPEEGRQAFETYLRFNYFTTKPLAWPSQLRGIQRLSTGGSFALCTPTGSGKTTVAEIAILYSLFRGRATNVNHGVSEGLASDTKPMALYLVPSRALASEVEAKLNRVLSTVTGERIIVTGLYGGNDWGPTDAWLTADDRTVLICTYEKAEALLRFLSPLFLSRVSLIVVDEAHNVQFSGDTSGLAKNESRALRLESLIARVLAYVQNSELQCIALSAVAVGFSETLANWITGSNESIPVQTSYRSTRQLVGCLDCFGDGRTEIRYDLLDGWDLHFEGAGQPDKPFVPNPFPSCPVTEGWKRQGPEKRLRPFLFWAAMHLAKPDSTGRQRSVLISLTQQPGGYAEDFLRLLNKDWSAIELPKFFRPPTERRKRLLWEQCLASCEDYFTRDSREYELLKKGIVLHHGKMPGLLARFLTRLIDEQIVNVVLATSTLTEGVNLPFETVLIPSLRRGSKTISVSEFNNLIGRAGRPGYGTEGRSLILLPPSFANDSAKQRRQVGRARSMYEQMIREARQSSQDDGAVSNTHARSPLAELLRHIWAQWQRITQSDSEPAFFDWLERTIPTIQDDSVETEEIEVLESLDTLDGILVSAIVEAEQLSAADIGPDVLEQRLQEVWQRTYAHYAGRQEAHLRDLFLRRGMALRTRIYPDRSQRRRIYRTGLRPVAGFQLIDIYDNLRSHLETGSGYAEWADAEKLQYIKEIVRQIAQVPEFALPDKSGRSRIDWENVLSWWLHPQTAAEHPKRSQISNWHNYVSQSFQYRFNWGLSSIIALATDDIYQGELRLPSLTDWPSTGLPWIVFWLKELIVWGTLDPVAAYLLSHNLEVTRRGAEDTAQIYYRRYQELEADERLNAVRIRQWTDNLRRTRRRSNGMRLPRQVEVTLLRDFGSTNRHHWRVIPVEQGEGLQWLDPAGFPLARSSRPDNWERDEFHNNDFFLEPSRKIVISSPYLR